MPAEKILAGKWQSWEEKSVNTLFKNQGIYNGLIAVMIFLATSAFDSLKGVFCLMCYIERRVLSDVLYHWRGSLWQHHQQSKDYPDAGWSGNPDIDIIAILMMVSRRMPAFFDEILPKKTPNWATVPE